VFGTHPGQRRQPFTERRQGVAQGQRQVFFRRFLAWPGIERPGGSPGAQDAFFMLRARAVVAQGLAEIGEAH